VRLFYNSAFNKTWKLSRKAGFVPLIDCLSKGGKEFCSDVRHKKPPADAVLITFLNLVTKWAPVLVVSGFLLPDQRWKSGHAHRNQGKVPSSKMLAQKQMLITRIAGANKNR